MKQTHRFCPKCKKKGVFSGGSSFCFYVGLKRVSIGQYYCKKCDSFFVNRPYLKKGLSLIFSQKATELQKELRGLS